MFYTQSSVRSPQSQSSSSLPHERTKVSLWIQGNRHCGVKIASIFIAHLNSISQRVDLSCGKFTSELTGSIINELALVRFVMVNLCSYSKLNTTSKQRNINQLSRQNYIHRPPLLSTCTLPLHAVSLVCLCSTQRDLYMIWSCSCCSRSCRHSPFSHCP